MSSWQAFIRGLDADPCSERLLERRAEAEGELTGQQITAVQEALRGGNTSNGCPPGRQFRVDIALRYPKVSATLSTSLIPIIHPATLYSRLYKVLPCS